MCVIQLYDAIRDRICFSVSSEEKYCTEAQYAAPNIYFK